MNIAIAAFAKTIGLSPVKTRLAETIGTKKAEEFYALSVDCTQEIIKNIADKTEHNISPYWAVGEEEGVTNKHWNNAEFTAKWTENGNLGDRLHHIYSSLQAKYQTVILIGTDSPQLNPNIFADAINKLNNNPESCIIGQCDDGGFYLFAAKIPLAKSIWRNVEYSTQNTLNELIAELKIKNINAILLPPEMDIDIESDLINLQKILENTKSLLPSQKKLLQWLEMTR